MFTKLKDFVGFNESDEYEYYDEDLDENDLPYQEQENSRLEEPEDDRSRRRRSIPMSSEAARHPGNRNNVIGMPGADRGPFEVVVIEPRSFEKMPQVIQALKERKSVILNLTMMEPEEAQRAVDFVAGGTYAMDGHQERVGESIFLFTPNCVQVTTHSGVVHEVAIPQSRDPLRSVVPTPAWTTDASIAQ